MGGHRHYHGRQLQKALRILADENMLEQVVVRLRGSGHDVHWAKETAHGAADSYLLHLATRERRTLITYDKDFGELIHRDHLEAPFGVILFRVHSDVPDHVELEFVFSSVTMWNSWPPGVWTIQIRHQPT